MLLSPYTTQTSSCKPSVCYTFDCANMVLGLAGNPAIQGNANHEVREDHEELGEIHALDF
jgi:hypothetical protein